MKEITAVIVVLLIALAGCTKDKGVTPLVKSEIKDPHVVAQVGDEKIMDSDIDAIFNQIPEQNRAQYMAPQARREFVSDMAQMKMMAIEAKKKGLDQNADVKRKLDFLYDQILSRELAEMAIKEIKVSDEDISKYFNEHKDKFKAEQKVKLRHILLKEEADAKKILAQLKKGDDFSKIATEKSICPSAKQGGNLGWAAKGTMVPEFEQAAFALKKGAMSGIVKTNFGYHIIMCDDVEVGKPKELSEVKGEIAQQLRNEKSEASIKGLIEQVKKTIPVVYNEDYFKKVQEDAAKNQAKSEDGAPSAAPSSPKDAPAAPKDAKGAK